MSLSPENAEKLKLVAKAALVAAAGATAVKYFRHEGKPDAFLYPMDGKKHKGFIAGFIHETSGRVVQFAGEITSKNFWPKSIDDELGIQIHDHGQTDEDVAQLADVFEVELDGDQAA